MGQSFNYWTQACVIAFLLLFEATGTGRATPQSDSVELRHVTDVFEFRSGVIVDSSGPAVYLMNPTGGIDAVDLSSGELLWSTAKAAKPLLLDGRRLISQAQSEAPAHRLRVVVLDARDGGKELLQAAVQLPEDVHVGIDDGLGTAFRASARLQADEVIVSWRYTREEIGGARPGPEDEARVTAGAVRVDLETGHADALGPTDVVPEPEGRLPDHIARLIMPGALRGPLWQVGGVLAAVERGSGRGGRQTILRRWRGDTGRPLHDVVLFDAELTFRYASADGAHLLASRRLESPRPGWEWRIYSLETGEQVANVRNALPAAWFFITGSNLILEAPPAGRASSGELAIGHSFGLRAIELTTSEQLWEWPFRDTAYRGPYPPARTGGSRTPNY